ncbi:MAG: DUF2304 domain-containing protein [Myxococcota bacterium]
MDMPLKQKIFAIAIAFILLAIVFELVRERRLKIEYSWLWILTGLSIPFLVWRYDLLLFLTNLSGAVSSTSTLFAFAFFFVILLNLHFSIVISDMQNKLKHLIQENAILRENIRESKSEVKIQ